MSITIENSYKNCDDEDIFEKKTHFIPCKIEEDGQANVQTYFEPYIKEDETKGTTCSFRGYPLNGEKVSLPPNYRALLVSETRRPLSEETDRKFHVAGGFTQMQYWNWDKGVTKNDPLMKCLDWIDVAEAAVEAWFLDPDESVYEKAIYSWSITGINALFFEDVMYKNKLLLK